MSVCHLANRLVHRNTHIHTLIHMASAAHTMIQMVSLLVAFWRQCLTAQNPIKKQWPLRLTGFHSEHNDLTPGQPGEQKQVFSGKQNHAADRDMKTSTDDVAGLYAQLIFLELLFSMEL